MTLPASGALSFNAINTELGSSGTASANLNLTRYRQISDTSTTSGTPISMSSFYSKFAPGVVFTISTGGSASQPGRYGLAFSGSVYISVGGLGVTAVARSTDGNTWTDVTSNLTSTGFGFQSTCCVVWNGSFFVIGGSQAAIATSPDGITWTFRNGLQTVWGTQAVLCIAWNGTTFVAGGSRNAVLGYSSDAITWTKVNAGNPSNSSWSYDSVAWGNGQFVAGGYAGYIYTSPDGVTWTYRPQLQSTSWGSSTTNSFVYALVWTGAVWVIGGGGGCATSSDAITWTIQAGWSFGNLFALTPGPTVNGVPVIIGGGRNGGSSIGAIATSVDNGVTWVNRWNNLNGVGYTTNSSITAFNWNGTRLFVGQGSSATSYYAFSP